MASGLGLLIWRPALAIRFFRGTLGRLLPRPLTEKIAEVMGSFIEGLGAMRDPRLVLSGMAWSVLHWCWGALALYVGLLAFGITRPGYPGALFLQAVHSRSFIPITFIGLYYVWRMGLSWGEVGHSEEIVEASG